ncbi:MAG: hypothetical protein K0Q52_167 [Microbacterium sp.]|nr:hypothetical protein [Microbacterium sp.]
MSLADPLVSAEYSRLDTILATLDLLPRLTDMQRAVIFGAIDAAPGAGDPYDYRAEYSARWRVVKEIRVGTTVNGVPLTLGRAAADCTDPTGDDILQAIRNAKEMCA